MAEKYIVKSTQVFTGIGNAPQALSILVDGKKIENVLPYDASPEGVPVTDYGDSLIVPSFIDAHTHIFSGAIDASDYVCSTLGTCTSQQECAEMIAAYGKAHPEQKRLRGSGWFVSAWNDAPLPDKRSLDALIPDRPVYMLCADSHSIWVNSKALEEMDLPADYDVEAGEVCRFENGEFTGLFIEPAAYAPANDKYMEFTQEELADIHESFQKELAKSGVCALSEMMAYDYTPEDTARYAVLGDLDRRGLLNAHVFSYTKFFEYTDFAPFFACKEKYDTEHFHIAGVKGFVDGVTETYTGLMLEPYTDKPDSCGENVPLRPKELMQEEIIAANKAGLQVRLHCISDGSVRMALDMFEASADAGNDIVPLRNTIEHIENIHPDDFPRFAELGVVPSVQPYHLTLSNNGKIFRLGAERCKYEFPNRTLYESFDQMALGTDYPVVSVNPFPTIYAALTRCDDSGVPTGQNAAEQTLPMDVILKCYTINAAKVYHSEDTMGSIEAGKLANFLVLSDNLFEIEPAQILKTQVSVNYFEGTEIYRA